MRLLTLHEAADQLGVKVSTLRFWVSRQRIEIVRLGRLIRVSEGVVRKLIEQGTVPAMRMMWPEYPLPRRIAAPPSPPLNDGSTVPSCQSSEKQTE